MKIALTFNILANSLVLLGFFLFDWNIATVLLIYLQEALIIGFYNILKMFVCPVTKKHLTKKEEAKILNDIKGVEGVSKEKKEAAISFLRGGFNIRTILLRIPFVLFFMFHYSLMLWGSYMAILSINNQLNVAYGYQAEITFFNIAFISFLVSHGISFIFNFILRGEYKNTIISELMTLPYIRVFVLYFTIVLGTFISVILGLPSFIISAFIIFKIIGDYQIHKYIHKKKQFMIKQNS